MPPRSFWLEVLCHGWCEAAAGGEGFLRGIRALSTYEVTRERQFAQLEKGLGKLSGLTAAQAGALLGSVEEALWSASQVERMQELVAEKTREATCDMQSGDKPALQDYTTLPYHLTEELRRAVDDAADREALLRQLCAHAGRLGLRFASEATKATLVALAHWRVLREGAVPAAEQHELYLRQKWKVCKCLGALPPPGVHVVDLPLRGEDVPVEVRLGESTGCRLSGARGRAAHEVCQFVRQMPLRKVHRSLQGDASSGRAAGAARRLRVASYRGNKSLGSHRGPNAISPFHGSTMILLQQSSGGINTKRYCRA